MNSLKLKHMNIAVVTMICAIGCTVVKMEAARPVKADTITHTSNVSNRRDTIKRLNADQLITLLNPAFNKLFLPEFKRLNSAIVDQASTIRNMSSYMAITRHRTDSIARERNSIRKERDYYRSEWLKGQKEQRDTTLFYQKQSIGFQKELIKQQSQQQSRFAQQINFNTAIAVVCLASVAIIFLLLIGLYRKIAKLSAKIASI